MTDVAYGYALIDINIQIVFLGYKQGKGILSELRIFCYAILLYMIDSWLLENTTNENSMRLGIFLQTPSELPHD